MSVNLMSAIFETEFFDLKDEKGNVTKASTAKLVLLALADHANDEGEGAYPSVERLCRKTALSEQTIRNTFDALRHNGILYLQGRSKYGTNNHTINTKSFPKAIGKEVTVLTLYPLDPLMGNAEGSNEYLNTPHPLDPNHHITIKETPIEPVKTDETQGHYSTAYNRCEEERPDKVSEYLQMANAPGMKQQVRIDAILSYLGEQFNVQTERKDWKDFAKHIYNMHNERGWDVAQFVKWLKSKPDFNIDYWSATKMKERYAQAFVEDVIPTTNDGKGFYV